MSGFQFIPRLRLRDWGRIGAFTAVHAIWDLLLDLGEGPEELAALARANAFVYFKQYFVIVQAAHHAHHNGCIAHYNNIALADLEGIDLRGDPGALPGL